VTRSERAMRCDWRTGAVLAAMAALAMTPDLKAG